MNKKIIIFVLSIVSVLFLTAQTCSFSYMKYDYTCDDGMQSLGESDVDCGGSYCDPCGEGEGCDGNDDCASGLMCDEDSDVCAVEITGEEAVAEEPTEAVEEAEVAEEGAVEEEPEDIEVLAEQTVAEVLRLPAPTRITLTDTDGDGLLDSEEATYGTAIDDADTDDDGLTDYEEMTTYVTDPLLDDTDGDGVNDGTEVTYNTDPLDSDSDNDGASDQDEMRGGTDPNDNAEAAFWIELGDSVTVIQDGTGYTITLFDIKYDDGYCDFSVGDSLIGIYDGASGTVDTLNIAVVGLNADPLVCKIVVKVATDTDGDGASDTEDEDDDNDGINDTVEDNAGTDSLDAADYPSCVDTEGVYGATNQDFTTKGTVTGGIWKSTGSTFTSGTDRCSADGKLWEYYCEDKDIAFSTAKSCETEFGTGYVCLDGACVSS